jgi:hypothetical protein
MFLIWCVYNFLIPMAVMSKAICLSYFCSRRNVCTIKQNKTCQEEPKFDTSGRYHFELRSLTSCWQVKFITFTFKKAPRYTSVSFFFFFVAILCYVQLHRIGCCFVIGRWENFLVTSGRASGEMQRRNLSFTYASSYHVKYLIYSYCHFLSTP